MKLARSVIGMALLLGLALGGAAALAQSTAEEVDCSKVTDPKKGRRSGKSYWGVATKKDPHDLGVLAKAEYQFALALCGLQDDWESNMFMGMVKCELGKYEEAGPYFTRAVELAEKKKHVKQAKDNRSHYWVKHYNEALEFFKQEAFALAGEEARIAIQIAPQDCRGHMVLGSAFASDRKFKAAIEVLEEAIELCPDNETLRENLFAAYHNHGNEIFNEAEGAGFKEAVVWYEKADGLRADDVGNLYYWGSALLQVVTAGDTTAIDSAREVVQRFADLAESDDDRKLGLWQLALIEIEAEDWEAAEKAATAYIEMAPLDGDGYVLMSRVLMKLGKHKELEPYIVMGKCLPTEPVADVAAWCDEARSRYGADSDFAKTDCPDEVRVHVDRSGKDWVVAISWAEARAVAYYDGEKKGEFAVRQGNP